MKLFRELAGKEPHMLKADIDAAYRRIPIMPSHRSNQFTHRVSEYVA